MAVESQSILSSLARMQFRGTPPKLPISTGIACGIFCAKMITHKADLLDIRSLSLIGCGNLLVFREAGTTITVKWETPQPRNWLDTVATFSTTALDGRKFEQPASWAGIEMLCRMGWRLSTPNVDWETVHSEWREGIGFTAAPWEADHLELTAEEGKAP